MTTENTPETSVRKLAILCALTATVAACFAAALYLATTNTLKNNGRWIPTKTTMTMPLFGANAYLEGTQALAGNRLNLGAWHGFHEVFYKYPLVPTDISFRFYLKKDAYLIVMFNQHDQGFEGIRFSANRLFKTTYLKGLDTGKFTEKQPQKIGFLAPNQWYDCRVQFTKQVIIVTLGEEKIYTIHAPPSIRRLGFRGGYNDAYIDDVTIGEEYTKEKFHETFANMRIPIDTLGIALLCIALAHLALYILARALWRNAQSVLRTLLILDTTLALFFAGAWLLQSLVFAGRYPDDENVRTLALEQDFKTGEAARRRGDIQRMHPMPVDASTSRVLFIGSSQTWGAGAQSWGGTFPMLIQERLNEELTPRTGMRYESINTGISGHRSDQLYEFYESEWVDLKLAVTVINLSTNDRDPIRFEKALHKFIDLNRTKGIHTILVQEANSIEPYSQEPFENHTVVRKVAEEQGVQLIAAHQYLRDRYDTGFLWWDAVHPTAYGYELLAETIGDGVVQALQ